MLHLPMEASSSKWDPGPGGLFTAMDNEEISSLTKQNIAAVPRCCWGQ